jgi:hypothetical protein
MPLALAVCGEGERPSLEAERRFFAKLRLPNGTWKTTYPNRLDDLNEWLLELLPKGRRLDVMDVAVSSGVSTLEWSDQLSARGVEHRLVAGDLCPQGWLTSWGDRFAVLFDDSGGEPLLLEIGPATLPVRSDRRLVRLTRPLLRPVLRAVARLARRLDDPPPRDAGPPKGLVHRPVSLVSAELRSRAEVEIVRDDVTVTGRFTEEFDVVRAANLVQRAYFDDDTLRSVLVNLRDRLRESGLLVVCRTSEDGINHATVFRRNGRDLVAEASINGGAEIRDLIPSP